MLLLSSTGTCEPGHAWCCPRPCYHPPCMGHVQAPTHNVVSARTWADICIYSHLFALPGSYACFCHQNGLLCYHICMMNMVHTLLEEQAMWYKAQRRCSFAWYLYARQCCYQHHPPIQDFVPTWGFSSSECVIEFRQ